MMRHRVELIREEAPGFGPEAGREITGPADVPRVAAAILERRDRESFLCFHLDAQHRVTGFEEVTRGILDASLIHPREVYKAAILSNAAAVILVHNHPSGDPKPSAEDRAVTRKLQEAGRVLGIPCLDHVVVGSGGRWQSVEVEG